MVCTYCVQVTALNALHALSHLALTNILCKGHGCCLPQQPSHPTPTAKPTCSLVGLVPALVPKVGPGRSKPIRVIPSLVPE